MKKNGASKEGNLLAQAVDSIFEQRGWTSLEHAARDTGASPASIHRMRNGIRVKPDTAMDFARRVGENPEDWAKMAMGLPVDSLIQRPGRIIRHELTDADDSEHGIIISSTGTGKTEAALQWAEEQLEKGSVQGIIPIHAKGLKDLNPVEQAAVALATEQTARAMIQGFKSSRAIASIDNGSTAIEETVSHSKQNESDRDSSMHKYRELYRDASPSDRKLINVFLQLLGAQNDRFYLVDEPELSLYFGASSNPDSRKEPKNSR